MKNPFKNLRKKTTENPVYREIGYWNGICPHCGTHVGINILENILTKKHVKFCAKCEKEIP
jgi:hypothetical protein